MRERDLQKLILDWLALHRIFHWRNNTGAMKAEHKSKKRFVRFGYPGSPDIFAMCPTVDPAYGAEMYGIELKDIDGEQSNEQKQFENDFVRAGGIYILARSLEDVTKEICG